MRNWRASTNRHSKILIPEEMRMPVNHRLNRAQTLCERLDYLPQATHT